MTWLLFFLIIVLVAVIAYLTGDFVNKQHTFIDKKPVKGSYAENMQDLDNNIMKYKQLLDFDIVADDDAVIELGDRLIDQARTVDMSDEYIGEIVDITRVLLNKN